MGTRRFSLKLKQIGHSIQEEAAQSSQMAYVVEMLVATKVVRSHCLEIVEKRRFVFSRGGRF